MTKLSSAISILRLCISSSISFLPSVQTSSSQECPNNPTVMTILPSRVRRFCASKNCSLKRVLPHRVMTLYLPTIGTIQELHLNGKYHCSSISFENTLFPDNLTMHFL